MLVTALGLASSNAAAQEFLAGADLSHLSFFESRGIAYRAGGEAGDALALLKARGLNCVRLRLFTSSPAQAMAAPYDYINNLDYTLPLAVRVKQAGLPLWLDFHYSDTWADPGHQAKPSTWTNLVFEPLSRQLRQYSSNCVAAFKAAGAMPDYVQVGNEIISGFLWTDGKVGGSYDTLQQWARLGQLLSAAIAGIEDASGADRPRIILHIDRGGDWQGTQWFFDHLTQQGIAFDLIGLSYYPFWHGSLDDLRTCLTNAATAYGKPVLIAETAFPWTNSADLYGIPATPAGQMQYVAKLAQIIKSVPAGRGMGICWWGTEYQSVPGLNLAGFDQRSLFDGSGNLLPAAEALGQLAAPLRLGAVLAGELVDFTWPLSGAGATLFRSTQLGASNAWLPVTNPVQFIGPNCSVRLRQSGPASFFRLQTP